jgi:transposase
MRRGFHGLSAQVQTVLDQQPLSGHVFVFRGRRGDIVKVFGSMAMASACWPSGSNGDASCGRRRPAERCR